MHRLFIKQIASIMTIRHFTACIFQCAREDAKIDALPRQFDIERVRRDIVNQSEFQILQTFDTVRIVRLC